MKNFLLLLILILSFNSCHSQRTNEKVCHLTFDDGPYPFVTDKVLDILHEYGVKATFFVTGRSIVMFPEILIKTHNEGHSIQNHTVVHPSRADTISLDSFMVEFHGCNNLIQTHIPDHVTTWYKAPGYKSNAEQRQWLLDTYNVQTVHPISSIINSIDWQQTTSTPQDIFDRVIGGLEVGVDQNNVVGMHDYVYDGNIFGEYTTAMVEALPRILEYMNNEGWTFLTLE